MSNEEKSTNVREMAANYLALARKAARYWKRAAFVAALVLAAGMVVVVRKVRAYRSEASAVVHDVAPQGAENRGTEEAQADLKARLDQVYGSRANAGRVVDELGLYPWLRGRASRMRIIESFQDALTFQGSGRDAFHLEFIYPDPVVSQRVVQRLLQLYTDERRATGQVQVHNDLASVNTALAGLETVLSDQEERLESFEHANHDMVEQVRLRRLGQFGARGGLGALAAGAGLGPGGGMIAVPVPIPMAADTTPDSPARRLRIRLAGLQSRQAALERAIMAPPTAPVAQSSAPVEESERVQGLRHTVSDLRERLARLRTTYTDQYPDVQITMHRVADAQRELDAAVAQERSRGRGAAVPAAGTSSEQLRAQLVSVEQEIEQTRAALATAAREQAPRPAQTAPAAAAAAAASASATATAPPANRRGSHEPQRAAPAGPHAATAPAPAAIAHAATSAAHAVPGPAPTDDAPGAATPVPAMATERPLNNLVEVESAWDRLNDELTTTRTRYQQLLSRKFELQATLDTVNTTGSDVLRVIDPPSLPAEPEPPGRTRLALMALALAVAMGLAVAGLSGYLDARIYEPADLRRWGELPELPMIPVLRPRDEAGGERLRWATRGSPRG